MDPATAGTPGPAPGRGRAWYAPFLGMKIGLGALFGSHILCGLFVPFLNLAAGGSDPWRASFEQGIPDAFPYGPVMFYVMFLPRILLDPVLAGGAGTVTWLHLVAARLPLLAADLIILMLLIRSLKLDARRATLLWWLSPVVLYVTYVHGQLDLIPTAFLMGSIVLVFSGRWTGSAVLLGLGLSTKLHLLVALPFIAVFVGRKEASWGAGLRYLVVSTGTYLISLFPWIMSPEFREMVFGTEEKARLFDAGISFLPGLQVYLAPLAIGLLFLQFTTYPRISRDTLLMFLGLSYTVLVSLIPPAHGYYIWSLPFIVYFFSKQTLYPRAALWMFNISTLLYLSLGLDSTLFGSAGMVFPQVASWGAPVGWLERWGADPGVVNSLLFTAVQVSVLTIAILMYRHGVQNRILHRPRTRPILVGIGGDSASGKHTTRNLLSDILGPSNLLTVDGDDVHKWERGHEMWKVVSHLDPEANDLYLQKDHADALGRGDSISRVSYDHRTGTFTKPVRLSPNKYVFVVGLHPFTLKRMRELLDIKIFMEPEEGLRRHWKVERDHRSRGYSRTQVLEQIERREVDAARFIRPQRDFADMAVRYYRTRSGSESGDPETSEMAIEIRTDNSLPLSKVAEELRRSPRLMATVIHEEDLVHQRLRVEGSIDSSRIQTMASKLLHDGNAPIAARPRWRGGHDGIVQLCFLLLLNRRLLEEADRAS